MSAGAEPSSGHVASGRPISRPVLEAADGQGSAYSVCFVFVVARAERGRPPSGRGCVVAGRDCARGQCNGKRCLAGIVVRQ